MTLDRWRGRGGILGWLVLRWDVYQLRRTVEATLRAAREARAEDRSRS